MTKNVVLALCLALASSADPALRGSAYPADGDAAINAEDVESLSCWPNCGGPGYGKPRATDSSVDKKPPVINGQ